MKVTIQFRLENKMRPFVTRIEEEVTFGVNYVGMNSKTSLGFGPNVKESGIAVFDPGVPITINRTRSGMILGKDMEHISNKLIVNADDLVEPKFPGIARPKASAPLIILDVAPCPFIVTFTQICPYSTKLFKQPKDYTMYLTTKLTDMKTRVEQFQKRFGTELANGKVTLANFNFQID